MGDPQLNVEVLVAEILRYNQSYFGMLSQNLNTIKI